MSSRRSSRRSAHAGAEPAPRSPWPEQRELRPEDPIRDLAEFLAFLEEFEIVAGRDDREREPISGSLFRL